MNVRYLTQRHKTYWYRRHVPNELAPIYGTGTYETSLRTHDLSTAIRMVEKINQEWEANRTTANDPQAALARAKKRVEEDHAKIEQLQEELREDPDAPKGVFYSLLHHLHTEEIEETLESGSLSARAYINVALNLLNGRELDEEFRFSLREGLALTTRLKANEVTPKYLRKYENAVNVFLGATKDVALERIRKQAVQSWVDDLKVAPKTKRGYLSSLSVIFDAAQTRGKVSENLVNPFRGIDSGKLVSARYEIWSDEDLVQIINHPRLRDVDKAVVLIAFYSGMRVSEIFNCTLTTVDGIQCFQIAPNDRYRGGKTEASNRLIPVHSELKEFVEGMLENLGGHGAFQKRFKTAKDSVRPNDRRYSVHSLRHSFTTRAQRSGKYTSEQVAWVTGHETAKGNVMTGRRYNHGPTIETLREIVESVDSLEGLLT